MGSVARQNRFNEIRQALRDNAEEIKQFDETHLMYEVFIDEDAANEHNLKYGYYKIGEIADMIYFLADMMGV